MNCSQCTVLGFCHATARGWCGNLHPPRFDTLRGSAASCRSAHLRAGATFLAARAAFLAARAAFLVATIVYGATFGGTEHAGSSFASCGPLQRCTANHRSAYF